MRAYRIFEIWPLKRARHLLLFIIVYLVSFYFEPPCQAFSIAKRNNKSWSLKIKDHLLRARRMIDNHLDRYGDTEELLFYDKMRLRLSRAKHQQQNHASFIQLCKTLMLFSSTKAKENFNPVETSKLTYKRNCKPSNLGILSFGITVIIKESPNFD